MSKFNDVDDIVDQLAKRTQEIKAKRTKTTSDSSNTIDIENDDIENLDERSKGALRDLTTVPDYYKILGVSPTATDEQVKNAGKTRVMKYHPDKVIDLIAKSKNPEKEKKKYDMLYKLVYEAYNVLKNPETRKGYDIQKKTVNSKNFLKQKTAFEDFKKLQESEMSEQSKENAKLKYDMEKQKLNKKHGFDESAVKVSLSMDEGNRKLEDLMAQRNSQECEYVPKNRFEGRAFSSAEFNKNWEKMKKLEEKKAKNGSKGGAKDSSSMVLWDGLAAANDIGTLGGSSQFTSIDEVYNDDDTPYGSGTVGNFAQPDVMSDNESELDLSDISDREIELDYIDDKVGNDRETMERKMKEFENMRKGDLDMQEGKSALDSDYWGDLMNNPFNVSAQMGGFVGNDIKALGFSRPKRNVFDKDKIEAYAQLVFDGDNKIEKVSRKISRSSSRKTSEKSEKKSRKHSDKTD